MRLLFKIEANLYSFQNISWVDFLNINPEIYLSIIILISLIFVGTANFIPQANTILQKKEVTLSIYALTKWSLVFSLIFYSVNLSFFQGTLFSFNSYSINDFYTNTLKFAIILTTLIILNAAKDYVKNHPRHLME